MINSGDTAWVLVCASLVLFMTPGLAFFYAGMVPVRNALSMMMNNFIPLGLVTVLWLMLGYSIAFGKDVVGGLFGGVGVFGMLNLGDAPAPALHIVSPDVAIPTLAFVAFQMMFAVITPALITGAVAGRLKFVGWALFVGIWSIVVYAPLAHWIFNPEGWLASRGVQDWAGGLVIHASAGAAALAVLLVVGRRRNWPDVVARPNSLPLVLIGAGILWFGWFGFNAGGSLAGDAIAAQSLVNTAASGAAGMLAWLVTQRITEGQPTVLGAVTGAIAGLATITPAAGYVAVMPAIAFGAIAGVVCHFAIKAKFAFGYDDALDVIAVHFLGGILGTFLLGLFGQESINSAGANGLFFGGGGQLLGLQLLGIVVVVAFSFVVSWLIAFGVQKTIGLRVRSEDENNLDVVQQGSLAYALDPIAGGVKSGRPHGFAPPPVAAAPDGDRGAGLPDAAEVRLVTGLADGASSAELREALTAAGALSIVLSQASLYTGEIRTEIFRSHRIDVDFHDRLRVEVLVTEPNVPDVLDALDRFADGPGSRFVQVVEVATTVRPSG